MLAPALLSARAVRLLDVALVLWALSWAALALVTAREMRQLGELGESAVAAANAAERTARALGSLRDVPVIGAELGDVEDEVARVARRARADARAAQDDVEALSLLLAAAIALAPTVPPLVLYVPIRSRWARERRAIARGLREGDRALDGYLADRARLHLPYDEMRRRGAGDAVDARALADAELARLGLRRPREAS